MRRGGKGTRTRTWSRQSNLSGASESYPLASLVQDGVFDAHLELDNQVGYWMTFFCFGSTSR